MVRDRLHADKARRLAIIALALIAATKCMAADPEVSVQFESPPVYVLDAPYNSRIEFIEQLGAQVLPSIGDLGKASVVVKLSSPVMIEEMDRLRRRYAGITEALYQQRFFNHRDELDLMHWMLPKEQVPRDAEEVIWRSARGVCFLDSSHRDVKQAAARTLEIIKSLESGPMPTGPARKLLDEVVKGLREQQAGPYRLARLRTDSLEACKASLKASGILTIKLSKRMVPLILADPNRNQYLEINSLAFVRGPMPGLSSVPIVLRRLSSFEPDAIQSMIDYWELSNTLGVFTKRDLEFFKDDPITGSGSARFLAGLKAAQKHALSVREFWKSQDQLHKYITLLARQYFTSEPPPRPIIRRGNIYWECERGLKDACAESIESKQIEADQKYDEDKRKSETEIYKQLENYAPKTPTRILHYYAEMINELKYKIATLPAEYTGEIYLDDLQEFIRSVEMARFNDSTFPSFVEDHASVPNSIGAPVKTMHDLVYRPLVLFQMDVPYSLDAGVPALALGANEFNERFLAQERSRAAATTSAISRYRPPRFYRIVDEIRLVRSAKIQLDLEQSVLAEAIRREREQVEVAWKQMNELSASGEVIPPVAGRIVGLYVAKGDFVTAGSPILSLSPLLNHSATYCGRQFAQTVLQPGMILDARLARFELTPDVTKAISGNEAVWMEHLRPALFSLGIRVFVDEDRETRCTGRQQSWRLSIQPQQKHPILTLRVPAATRVSVAKILDRLNWRHFTDEDEMTIAVDGSFIDDSRPVSLAVVNK